MDGSGKASNASLAITVDRSSRLPAVELFDGRSTRLMPFYYSKGPLSLVKDIDAYLKLDSSRLLEEAYKVWQERQAVTLYLGLNNGEVVDTSIILDDFLPATWPEDRAPANPDELEAAESLLVYLRKDGDIGTIVNGAGLAMSTLDVLRGRAANFMDCGGKATSKTVAKALEIILRNPNVKAMFVNIFGGLTKGDMIANGVVDAVRALQVKLPIVVRIRGTNEAEGQKIIAESGLGLYPEIELDAAVNKVMNLADGGHDAGKGWVRG